MLLLGLIFLGKEFALTTGYATVVLSADLMLLEKACPLNEPLSDQPMLELIFAIALPAIASALFFGVGASSGGTDVIALIVEKYTHLHSIAAALFLTDLVMVVAACFVFDLHTALYSFVGLTVKSLMIDVVLERMKMCKAILIVCDDKDIHPLQRCIHQPAALHYLYHPDPARSNAAAGVYPQGTPERLYVHAEHHRSVRQGL